MKNSLAIFLAVQLCVSCFAIYLPNIHKRRNTLDFQLKDLRFMKNADDNWIPKTTLVRRRTKRSFVDYRACPEGECRLPRPINRCVPRAEYECFIKDLDDNGINEY